MDKTFNAKFPTPHIIAYIDFLGVKSMLKSNKQIKTISSFYFIFSTITEIIEKINKNYDNAAKCIKYKIFSDNVVFAIECTQNTFVHNATILLHFIAIFQYLVISDFGYLLRGGICTGDLYIDNNFVLGPGLTQAYEMEDILAIYPRIIIDASIIDRINLPQNLLPYLLGSDNLFYVNYLHFSDNKELNKHYNQILHKSDGIKDLTVKQKYDWVKLYHNIVVDLKNEGHKFNDIYQTPSSQNNNINGISIADKFKSIAGHAQTVAHTEGSASVNNETVIEAEKSVSCDNTKNTAHIDNIYKVDKFSKVSPYSETPYVYVYQDTAGKKYVTLSDINRVTASSGSFTSIALHMDGTWVFNEWNDDTTSFENKVTGRFIFDPENTEGYILLRDYESKIRPILDKYVKKYMN